jgi:hypothetical protein
MSQQDSTTIEEMFVQLAGGASSNPGVLTLESVSPSTLYLSDRQERIVGHVTTGQFVDDWDLGPDSFESDPPNALLTFPDPTGALEDVVLELKSPRLRDGRLTYSVEVLEGSLPEAAGPCTLLIDPLGRPLSPISVCGVRRRERRRMRRRSF